MSHQALVRAIETTVEQIEAGSVAWDDVADLAARAQIEARAASSADRTVIAASLAALELAVKGAMERLASELRTAGQARSAISAYKSVRPHTKAQRVRTRA